MTKVKVVREGKKFKVFFKFSDELKKEAEKNENAIFGIELKLKAVVDDLVRECISITQLNDFIKSLPNDINTEIGEFGTKISGGQKQRIAIARALYNKPKILVLDEATSAVDGINEKSLQQSLDKLYGFITTITIAHKMSTIEKCDHIILLDNGEIVSEGNFLSLKKKSSLFRNLITTSYK